MINSQEVKQLLKDGNFLTMNLAELQREHAELIAFNSALDRKSKATSAEAKKYKIKVFMIAETLKGCEDKDLALRAIKGVVEQVGSYETE